jgi:hypothetical protein
MYVRLQTPPLGVRSLLTAQTSPLSSESLRAGKTSALVAQAALNGGKITALLFTTSWLTALVSICPLSPAE